MIELCLGICLAAAPLDDSKSALQALNEVIGDWKGMGSPDTKRPASKDLWNESVSWGWRFKGDDAWLTVKISGGKYYREGELRYLPAKKVYQLTLTNPKSEKEVFEGEYKDGYLRLDRKDPKSQETQRLTMNTAAEGIRLIYGLSRKPAGRTLFTKDWQVALTKEGESLATKEKKNECIVSGGLGTSTVSYKGQSYYVCCSGCREAFVENPEKFIKEAAAKKK